MKAELPDELFSILQVGVPALLITVDAEGFPHTAFTFAAASARNSLSVVMDEGSTTQKNIERTRQVSVQILAEGNQVYLLKGNSSASDSRMKSSPAPARRLAIELTSAKNQAWPEIAVSPLAYQYSQKARATWEGAVAAIYAELRGK